MYLSDPQIQYIYFEYPPYPYKLFPWAQHALPVGVDGKSYWEAMILGITNNKFCSLRANFKQELFEQFQGKFYSI